MTDKYTNEHSDKLRDKRQKIDEYKHRSTRYIEFKQAAQKLRFRRQITLQGSA